MLLEPLRRHSRILQFAEGGGGGGLKSGALVILMIMYIATVSILIGTLHLHVTLPDYFSHSEVCLLIIIN